MWRVLLYLFPADLRSRQGSEIVADLQAVADDRRRVPLREVGALVAEALRLRATRSSLASSVSTSLTWSLGLVVGAGLRVVGTQNGSIFFTAILGVVLLVSLLSHRTFLWITAIVAAMTSALGIGGMVFVASGGAGVSPGLGRGVGPATSNVPPGMIVSCIVLLLVSLALRRHTMMVKPSAWTLLAIPCGLGLSSLQVGGSVYALVVLGSIVLAFWNPYPAIVLTSIPWLLGVGPMAVSEMFVHRNDSVTGTNLWGMLAITAVGAGWVIGNHQRVRRAVHTI